MPVMAVARVELTPDELLGILAVVEAAKDPDLRRAHRELLRGLRQVRESEERERNRPRGTPGNHLKEEQWTDSRAR